MKFKGKDVITKKIDQFKADGLSECHADLLMVCVDIDPEQAELEVIQADLYLFSLRTTSRAGNCHITHVPSPEGRNTLLTEKEE